MIKLRFTAHDKIWETEAEPGVTLRDASKQVHAPVGDACGGVCACSTCHVYVRQGGELLSEAEEEEEDILDKAFDVRPQSRLGCQAKIMDGARQAPDAVIEIDVTRESLDAFFNEHPDEIDFRG